MAAAALLAAVAALLLVAIDGDRGAPGGGVEYSGIPPEWQNRNVLGNPDAPVTLQVWEDFRCPACAAFNRRVKPALVENYIAGGNLKLEFSHFPLRQHEPGASLAAQASECAADQGRFWAYHDRVFQATSGGPSAFIVERLIDYAVELDLDEDAFTGCLTSQTHHSTVVESLQAGREAGVNATPYLLIDGYRIDSPLDYEAVSSAVDALTSTGQ